MSEESEYLMYIFNGKEKLSEEERKEVRENENPSSFISYEDERFWLIMEWAFRVKSKERLIGLTVSLEGISALIRDRR